MYCGMKELNKIFNGAYSDSEIIYKGISFNEYDIIEIAENDLATEFSCENKSVADLIEEGILTEKSRDLSWDKDTGDMIDDYLNNENNHDNILSSIDDMICNMQTDELYDNLSKKADEKYDDKLEYDYCDDAMNALSTYVAGNKSNLMKVILTQWNEREYAEVIENSCEPYSNLKESFEVFLEDNCLSKDYKELCEKVLPENKRPQIPYLLYIQNHKYCECKNADECVKSFEKMMHEYEDLAAVVFNVDGTVFKGELNIDGLKELKKICNK